MTSCTVQSGTVCTQVGPSSYARTPIFITSCGGNPGNPTVSIKYGAPVYSSDPCGSSGGASQGDSTTAPTSVPPPPPTDVGPGQSFTLSQLTNGVCAGYDPACGMYYGFVSVTYGAFLVDICVWGSTATSASWSSTPPPRNTMTDGTWYSFPTARKWVVVGDGIFRTTTFGKSWEKRQDWVTTPHRCFYAAQGVLVGCSQTATGVNFLASQDDGATWSVFYSLPNCFIQTGSIQTAAGGWVTPANYQPDASYAYAQNLGTFGQSGSQNTSWSQLVAACQYGQASTQYSGPAYLLLSYGNRPDVSSAVFGWTLMLDGGGLQTILFSASVAGQCSLWGVGALDFSNAVSSPFTLAGPSWNLGLRGRW